MQTIGIRCEDKSRWEARVPLTPEDMQRLSTEDGLMFVVERSDHRAFSDAAYAAVGIEVTEKLDCPIVMGVKEIPPEKFEAGKTYAYFSHTIKGQPANMPALRRLMQLGCNLIDYERIVDDEGRRIVFFGRFAGLAGMIDTLWALGKRLEHEGITNPFSQLEPAHRYADIQKAKDAVRQVGADIADQGLPQAIRPFVCGFAGYGQVSTGAQEIFDLLPVQVVAPEDLATLAPSSTCAKVVFKEQHLVERIDRSRPFALPEYYDHPERYRANFFTHSRHLTVLMNCIYWEPKYPRLLSREELRLLYAPGEAARLKVVGDISCDVDGAVACTTMTTGPEAPVFVYEPATGEIKPGFAGEGPVVLAVDVLPCELPVDASKCFSQMLSPFLPGLARANFGAPRVEAAGLPAELQRATIVFRGQLTAPYEYLHKYVD